MSDEELPPALAEAYGNRKPFGRGFETRTSPKDRRSANGALTALVAIYVITLAISAILYFVGFAAAGNDPLGAVGIFAWANAIGGIGVLGVMLHLAVAAIRRVVEDNASRG